MSNPAGKTTGGPAEDVRIVEIDDERGPFAEKALSLIHSTFPASERQPIDQIEMEIAEKRLGLLTSYDFHLVALARGEDVTAIASGVYLGGVNCGFVTYLAVSPEHQSQGLGRRARTRLIEIFRQDAQLIEWPDLAAVVGEVRLDSPWLGRLVRERAVVPLDFEYFHPGQDPATAHARWVLYRQPVGDTRSRFPASEVRQVIYSIWRRAYRVRWPLERPGFLAMLAELEGRDEVGSHPEVVSGER